MFDDFFDLFDWFWFGFGGEGEPEEVKKARERLRKAREDYYEARRKAWEKQMEELKKASEGKELVLPSTTLTTLIPFGGSEEEFQAAVERFARAHPDARVEAKSITFPNGYYRSIKIEKKRSS